MEICTDPGVLKIIKFINSILNTFFIVLPIVLIIIISIDFFKCVFSNKEDELKEKITVAIKRIICCIFIFFIPTVVSLLNSMLGSLGVEYAECLTNANDTYIEGRYVKLAKEALEEAEVEKNMTAVILAEKAINKIKDDAIRESLSNRATELREEVAELKKVQEEEKNQQNSGTSSNSSITNNKYLYQLENPDLQYSGHSVDLTSTQYLLTCRALLGERESSSFEIYVALAQYIRDHVDAYKAVGTNYKNYDNIGSRWLISAGGDRAGYKSLEWIQENRPEIIKAVDYVFKNGGSFAQGFLEFYVDKYDGSTPEIASNNLIYGADQHCSNYGGSYSNHENFTLYPQWGDTSHWFSCSICPWYSGVRGVSTKR